MNNRDQSDSGAGGAGRPGRVGLRATRWVAGALLLMTGLAPGGLPAQTNTPKATSSNRCLLIVDTSRSMQRRAPATLKVVQDLVTSGLNGQLRSGDTLGLWTFNATLQASRLPLQTWSPEARWDIAARALAFLKAQKYEKQASFDQVLPALAYVVEHSGRVTVILITSGEEKIRGTPFDEPISQFYQQWHDQQQKARMPFVTVLRAQNGRLVDFALNTPPWPLQIPSPPPDTRTAEDSQTRLQQALQKAQSTTAAPPLIVTGKKPKPAEASASLPAPTTVKTQAPPVVAGSPATGTVAVVASPKPSSPPVPTPVTSATPSSPDVRPAQPPSPPGPPPAESKPAPTNAPPPKPADSVPPRTATNAPPQYSSAPGPKPALTSALPPSPAAPPRPAPPASAQPAPSAQAGAATPAEPLSSFNLLWLAVAAVAVLLAALIMLRAHRARSVSQGSLITRSYEREKKP